MAYQARVQIKNELKEDQKIKAIRKISESPHEQFIEIARGEEERFMMVDTLQLVTIQVPDSKVTEGICFKFCTKVNLQATYSKDKKKLDIRLLDTGGDLEIPTTVNVTVGDEKP